jgi:Tfp pilus assembly protein PilV
MMIYRLSLVKGEQGFTFNEVLVAASITVVAILAYSLSAVGVIREQKRSDNLTVAIQLAQDKMEQVKSQTDMANENRCPNAGERELSATGTAGGIFDRCWTISDSAFGANLKQVNITVSWRDYENHEVTISTLIYRANSHAADPQQ